VRRPLSPAIAATLLVTGAFVTRLRVVDCPDAWWHLSMGRAALHHGARAFPDPVGPSAARMYVDPEWLFDVMALGAHGVGGEAGLVALSALLGAIAVGLCMLLARQVSANGSAAVLVGALAWGGAGLRFVPRPQSLFLVLLTATVLAGWWVAHSVGRRRTLALASLIATGLVWSQSHSSIVIFPFVAVASALPAAWGAPTPLARGGLLALAATLLIPLASPFGLDLPAQILAHSGSDAAVHIQDMAPPTISAWWPLGFLDGGPGQLSTLFLELLLGVGVVGSVRRRSLPLGPVALAVLGLALALTASRFSAAWTLLAIPWASWSLQRVRDPRLGWLALAAVGASLVASTWNVPIPSPQIDRSSKPVAIAAVLERLPGEAIVFNHYDVGGYLGWALYGKARVFIDGRTPTHFSEATFFAARAATGVTPQVFVQLDDAMGFGAAVVPAATPICRALARDPAWRPGWIDERFVLFIPADTASPAMPPLDPCATDREWLQACLSNPAEAPRLREQIEALVAWEPSGAALARRGALLALACGAPDPARARRLMDAAAIEPDHVELDVLEGMLAASLGDVESALLWLDGAGEGHSAAQALALTLATDPADVRARAERLITRMDDATPTSVRARLAQACATQGDDECAHDQALRAALLGDAASLELLRHLDARGATPEADRDLTARLLAQTPAASPSTP
jgi:hypothetical protein